MTETADQFPIRAVAMESSRISVAAGAKLFTNEPHGHTIHHLLNRRSGSAASVPERGELARDDKEG